MPNNPYDTMLFDKAASFAIQAHSGTERRDKGIPYALHTMEAAVVVASITRDPELLAAALLHDTVEDTDVTVEEIRAAFGDRVAKIVEAESDVVYRKNGEKIPWLERKIAGIDRLKRSDRDVKIVSLGDKLSNMRAIAQDYDRIGDALWQRFHAPNPRDIGWRYRALKEALFELSDTAAYREFAFLVDYVFDRAFPEPGKEYKGVFTLPARP